jgi:YfiR/HmsC-like
MYFSDAPYRRRVAVFAAAVLVLCILQRDGGFAAELGAPPASEYQVKAAFVYNFIKFVEWPAGQNAGEDTLRLCVLGDVPAMAPFADLDGKMVKGKRLTVSTMMDPQTAGACQVLFVSSSLSRRMNEVLDIVKGRPTLTVGDTEGYARRGIMINMYLDNKRVRFEINAKTARTAGLRVSTKLMSLAGMVHGGDEAEE